MQSDETMIPEALLSHSVGFCHLFEPRLRHRSPTISKLQNEPIPTMKTTRNALPALALLAGLPLGAAAQTTLVDWNQNWSYLHPTAGALPDGSGTTTPHPDGTTPWFATDTDFGATYTGPSFTTGGIGFEAGSGIGPIGYGDIAYSTTPDPIPPDFVPPEFDALGTTLTTPTSGERFTAYFRTTFTIPDDGNFYTNPRIRYILDDGAFVYLDGEPILEVNIAADVLDDYESTAAGTGNTESQIRTANLALAEGSRTGGNTMVDPAIANNATVLKSFPRLSPGTHTLAISVHNSSATSSDLALAVQVVADVTDCVIAGSASTSSRDFAGTPAAPSDDTISTEVTVVPEGNTSIGWEIVGPVGSALVGQTGAYNTPVSLTGIPIAEFAGGGPLSIQIADSANATCTTIVDILPQRILGFNSIPATATPILTIGDLTTPGWTHDDSVPSLTINNPGGPAGTTYRVTSQDIDLSGEPDVQFTGTLTINDTSSGNEEEDSFVAYLILDDDTDNPVNLITRHDLITEDGILTGDELASGQGDFVKTLNHVIPASVNSVRFVIEGVNNSTSEVFTVSNLGVASAPPELQAYAGPVYFDNKGTDTPSDDRFGADVTITPVNLGASTSWFSNSVPFFGLYSDPNPVAFIEFEPFQSPATLTLTDSSDSTKTVDIQLANLPTTFNVSGPTNIVRVENGPGFEDDTVTFDLEITGSFGGPGWNTTSFAVTPSEGDFGIITFTVPAPLPTETITFDITDRSYRSATEEISLPAFGRYVVGQSDLTGDLTDLLSSLTVRPSTSWIKDDAAGTLTYSAGGTALRVVETELVDLTAQDEVFFSATLSPIETSGGSNFENTDRFKAELIYTVGGVPTTINLVTPFDIGDGAASTTGTTGGVNGPPNGFINGYRGTAGTDLEDGTIYAAGADDYNAHLDRDEFNRLGELASADLNGAITLASAIPAEADDVKLVLTAQGIGGSERIELTNILFSTSNNTFDTDEDGMPNDYETANGLNPNDAGDRDTDLDGDGRSNYSEFIAGTNPQDPFSLLEIVSYTLTDTTVSASWSSVPGKTYRFEFSTDLENWTDLGFDFPANDAPATETETGPLDLATIGAPEDAYFRVIVVE